LARQSAASALGGDIVFAYETSGLRVALTGKTNLMAPRARKAQPAA
jgi:hypothetical protein